MGQRERERKAKRALAELGHAATPCKAPALTPAAKRHASVVKKAQAAVAKAKDTSAKVRAIEPPPPPPPASARVGNEPWQVVGPPPPPTPRGSVARSMEPGATQPEKDRSPSPEPPPPAATTGSASSSEPPKPAGSPRPNPAAGAEAPQPGVSSGGVDAELKVVIPIGKGGCKGKSNRKDYDYDEGKDGKYTCLQCGMKPLRSYFLIEAVDGDGNVCPELDREGRLDGRCYACCRGWTDPYGPPDIYEDLVALGTHSEEVLQGCFRRECNKRHGKRSDVKKNEHAQLKIKAWKELLAKIIEKKAEGHVHE